MATRSGKHCRSIVLQKKRKKEKKRRNVLKLYLKGSREGFCRRGRGRSFYVKELKTQKKAREPTVKSLVTIMICWCKTCTDIRAHTLFETIQYTGLPSPSSTSIKQSRLCLVAELLYGPKWGTMATWRRWTRHTSLHFAALCLDWLILGCRLEIEWGKSWMGQAEDSMLTELKQAKECERYPNRFRRLHEKRSQRPSFSFSKKTANRKTL